MPEANGNDSQMEAIRHNTGPMLVLAGPGSGKTFTTIQRIQYLIEHHKADPAHILVITFTKAAAAEMRERFQKLMHGKRQSVTFGTFHAVYYQIIKQAYHYQSDSIITQKEKIEYLKRAISAADSTIPQSAEITEVLLNEISRVKNREKGMEGYRFLHAQIEQAQFEEIFSLYTQSMRRARKIDFDDMVLLCAELLHKRPDILAFWQNRYLYILIDEFQDISPAQYDVIRLLALPENNLFAVGDDDQSIYGFRGANPEIMMRFETDYPNASRVLLSVNYRSSGNIVACSQELIKDNKTRFPKQITAAKEQGAPVVWRGFCDKEEEYKYLLNSLKEKQKQGALPKCAVIFRTNQEITAFAEKLAGQKIPYITKEKGKSLYDHFVAKDLIGYLRFAAGEYTRELFLRIMNKPARQFSRDCVQELPFTFSAVYAFYQGQEAMCAEIRRLEEGCKAVRSLPPYLALNYVRKAMDYDRYLSSGHGGIQEERRKWLELADRIQDSAKDYRSISDWLAYVEERRENVGQTPEQRGGQGVNLVTMHGSKGLQYESVYLPDLNEGVVPHGKIVEKEEEEEERRMLYVAMTRAEEELALLYVKGKTERPVEPSRFISKFIER